MEQPPTGDNLVALFSALANPHRLRVIAALGNGRAYVSELARQLNMSRPLLLMHLKKLQAAGLITGELHLSDEGKAMHYFEVTSFDLHLTPELIEKASRDLSPPDKPSKKEGESA